MSESAPHVRTASLKTRVAGYVVDMVIFAAMAMVVMVVVGAVFLWAVGGGTDDAPDSYFYAAFSVVAAFTPLLWSAMNVALLAARGQTGGQYVAGVRLEGASGGRPAGRQILAWWLCLNPLLFNVPMILVTAVPITLILFISLSRVALFLLAVLVTLFVVAPVLALISAIVDDENRALHDRVAGVVVTPAE